MSVPSCVKYSNVKPKGFATKLKRWKLNPQSSYNSFNKNELVRFVLESDGYVDPYRIYIEVIVNTSALLEQNAGVIMLDGPSTSLLQTMTIYSGSKQIERIDEYDQLGNILRDMQYKPLVENNRQYEGYAFNDIVNNQSLLRQNIGSNQASSFTQNNLNYLQSARFRPFNYQNNIINVNATTGYSQSIMGQQALNRQLPTADLLLKQRFDLGFQEADTEFGIDVSETLTCGVVSNTDTLANCNEFGYLNPYSYSLARGKSTYLCPVGQKLKVKQGKFDRGGNVYGGVSVGQAVNPGLTTDKVKLLIPLLSGVIGILIPQDQWKLLPLAAFKQLMFEFRFNPYAFFGAGYAAGTKTDDQLILPNWKIESIQMVFDIWYFDSQVTSALESQLNGEGIILSSQTASMGPIYNIISNGTVTNNWQINNGIESCKALMFWFLDNAYQKYPFLRKNFRLSHNIKSVQLKVGADWIPPYPIEGHSGNIGLNSDPTTQLGDNTDFLVELQKTFMRLFDCKENIMIDKLNFAINERTHDSTYNTALYGCSLWEEMRCQGKAIYTINLDQNPYDGDVLSGLDTTKLRPIELVIKGTDLAKFTGDSTMYVLLWHDFYVQINNQGITTYGQG